MKPLARHLAAASTALLLAACGGGGGGGGGALPPPPPPAGPTIPLAFTEQNAAPAAGIAIGFVESALIMGRWALDEIEAQAQRGVLSSSGACALGGVREATLVDADGSNSVTPGDRLGLRLTGCYVAVLESALTGSVEILVTAPVAAGGRAGELRIAAGGLRATTSGEPEVTLGGGLAFDGAVRDDDTEMAITALPATDLTLALDVANRRVTERLRPSAIVHRMSLLTARYELRASATLQSESLDGQVELTTVDPLVGWLDALPDAARLRLAGRGSSNVTVTPQIGASGNQALVRLDADGNGVAETQGTLDWNLMFEGYPWWPQARLRAGETLRALQPGQFTPFFTLRRVPNVQSTALRPTLEFDFTTPPDPATLPQFKLIRRPADRFLWGFVDHDWGDAEVVLSATLVGTRLTLTSPVQLQPGRQYEWYTRAPGSAVDDPQPTVRDTLGRASVMYVATLNTRPTFQAHADFALGQLAGALLGDFSLVADRARDTERGIVGYHWRQVSGPTATILAPNSPRTLLRLANPAPAAPETVVVELTVANADGDIDVATLAVNLVPTAGTPSLYFRSSPRSFVGGGQVRSIATGSGNIQFQLSTDRSGLDVTWDEPPPGPGQSGPQWFFAFARPDGQPIVPGTYTNAYANFGGDGRGASWEEHDVRVLDIAWDGAGNLTRLAIDFGVGAEDERVYGSIRLNSSLPIRY